MRRAFALAVLSLSLAGCLAPSESASDDTPAALESAHTDSDAPSETIGEAADEDAIGAIAGGVGGTLAGAALGGYLFGPIGALLGGLAGGATAGWYGGQASSDRPPWPGSPPPLQPSPGQWPHYGGDTDR